MGNERRRGKHDVRRESESEKKVISDHHGTSVRTGMRGDHSFNLNLSVCLMAQRGE